MATSGNDNIQGTSGSDLIDGLGGNDIINGLSGNDTLLGNSGNDTLIGGTGNDLLTGGAGRDTYVYNAREFGSDTIEDFDLVYDKIDVSALGIADLATLKLFATSSGGDTIIRFGYDYNSESITLRGIDPDDLTNRNFTFNTSRDATSKTGTSAGDALFGGLGADTLRGVSGNDVLASGSGNDTLIGGTGNDTLYSGAGRDTIVYDAREFGNDIIKDFDLTYDKIDLSRLGIANLATLSHFMTSSGGNTVISFGYDYTAETITLEGIDPDDLKSGNFVFNTSHTALVKTGSTAGDAIFGGLGNDTLRGAGGNDVIAAGSGNDTLIGGNGNDTLYGEVGRDIFVYDDREFGNDIIKDFDLVYDRIDLSDLGVSSLASLMHVMSESGGNTVITMGFDYMSESITLEGIDLSDLNSGDFIFDTSRTALKTSGSTAGDVIFGGLAADTLSGMGGNDLLIAGAGNDTLIGGNGNDTFYGEAGRDTYVYNDREFGNDVIKDFDLVYDKIDLSDLGVADLDTLMHVISESSGSTTITMGFDYASESIKLEGIDISDLTGRNFVFNTSTAALTTSGSTAGDVLFGGLGNDTLRGMGGNDIIASGAGNDTLIGGSGFDKLIGGSGADTFLFYEGDLGNTTGTDVIVDFSRAEGDIIDLSDFDARIGSGTADDAFSWIGTRAFTGIGQLRYEKVDGMTIISGNTDSDLDADFTLVLDGSISLGRTDFML
ncbi:M10 family metallopeptidase C-terminal domain-containing protein [Acetobacteraceae bacterium H6797]|nr:M10 family metallopeptidase C-terminal domain-containing protein [Acetobacteraceae bacterium H6797]